MRISKKAVYAVRALAILAASSSGEPMQIGDLATKGQIPVKFLEQILLILKRANLLKSKRGIGGGYQLNKPPTEITVAEVLRVIDGDLVSGGQGNEGSSPGCQGLAECLKELDALILSHLEEETIETLLLREEPDGVLAFEI